MSITSWATAVRAGLKGMLAELVTGLDQDGNTSAIQIAARSGQWVEVFDLTLVLDTNIYASGDVLAIPVELANVGLVAGAGGVIIGVHAIDEDDQGQNFDVVFLNANQSLGTINLGVSITDAASRALLGYVEIDTWKDLWGVREAQETNLGIGFECAAASTSIWVGAISRGTGTYTASGIRLKIAVLQGM